VICLPQSKLTSAWTDYNFLFQILFLKTFVTLSLSKCDIKSLFRLRQTQADILILFSFFILWI
jgi:hypothetical protein